MAGIKIGARDNTSCCACVATELGFVSSWTCVDCLALQQGDERSGSVTKTFE